MAGEQSIFSSQSQTADRTLDRVGIDLDAAVFQKAAEAVPVVEAERERLSFAMNAHSGSALASLPPFDTLARLASNQDFMASITGLERSWRIACRTPGGRPRISASMS